jgi:hypothetical protein
MKVVKHIYRLFFTLCTGLILANTPRLAAQTNFSIFSDGLNNGFQNWSWGNVSFDCLSPVYGGTNSISYDDVAWEGISFWHPDFNPAPYTNLDFWLNGGSVGGQVIQVFLQYSNSAFSGVTYQLPALSGGIFLAAYFYSVQHIGRCHRLQLESHQYSTDSVRHHE